MRTHVDNYFKVHKNTYCICVTFHHSIRVNLCKNLYVASQLVEVYLLELSSFIKMSLAHFSSQKNLLGYIFILKCSNKTFLNVDKITYHNYFICFIIK